MVPKGTYIMGNTVDNFKTLMANLLFLYGQFWTCVFVVAVPIPEVGPIDVVPAEAGSCLIEVVL